MLYTLIDMALAFVEVIPGNCRQKQRFSFKVGSMPEKGHTQNRIVRCGARMINGVSGPPEIELEVKNKQGAWGSRKWPTKCLCPSCDYITR